MGEKGPWATHHVHMGVIAFPHIPLLCHPLVSFKPLLVDGYNLQIKILTSMYYLGYAIIIFFRYI